MLAPDREELLDWLKARFWFLLAAVVLAAWGGHAWLTRPLHPPPGVLAPEEPVQGPPGDPAEWTYRDHQFRSLATFELHARVLSRERYRFDRAAELSPLDLALGWGRMSDSSVLARIQVRQDNRWYYWSAPRLPIPEAEIGSHSANMHMIPATPRVKDQLLDLRVGQAFRLRGQLIHADGRDRWTWTSSLSRLDTGEGACEVIWVERVDPD